jgi:hypothetical protein
MGWSWKQLHDETPEYVRQYSWDFMQARIAAEISARDRSAGEAQRHA